MPSRAKWMRGGFLLPLLLLLWTTPMAAKPKSAPKPRPLDPIPEQLKPYLPYISRVAADKGLPPELLLAQIMQESSGKLDSANRKDERGRPLKNPANWTFGPMQLKPGTADDLGVTDIHDPRQNIEAGARYLLQHLGNAQGNLNRALSKYNTGPNKERKTGKPAPTPTGRSYARSVQRLMEFYKNDVVPPIPYHTPPPKEPAPPTPTPSLWEKVTGAFSQGPIPKVSSPILRKGAVPPVVPGNINPKRQPTVKNPDGSTSTVDTISVNVDDGRETVIPQVMPWGTHFTNPDDAIDAYLTHGRHLGKFRNVDEASNFAAQLHEDYENGKFSPKFSRIIKGKGLRK